MLRPRESIAPCVDHLLSLLPRSAAARPNLLMPALLCTGFSSPSLHVARSPPWPWPQAPLTYCHCGACHQQWLEPVPSQHYLLLPSRGLLARARVMMPLNQIHTKLLGVMAQLLPSYLNPGQLDGQLAIKREGPAIEQNPPPKRGRGAKQQRGRPEKEAPHIQSLTAMMGKLILMHEDALNSLALESEFMVFLQAGTGGLVEPMVRVSEMWHAKTQNGPMAASRVTERSPLRMMMAISLFTELMSRSAKVVEATPEGAKLRQELIAQKLLTGDGQKWHHLQWAPDQEKLVPTDTEPLDVYQAHHILQEIKTQVQTPGVIIRFHALRSLQRYQAKDGHAVIPWKLTVGLREESALALYRNLQLLCGCALTQLVLMRMRPANMKRSGLAQQISQSLRG